MNNIDLHNYKEFVRWMRDTGNSFHGEEFWSRYNIWQQKKRAIEKHNNANLGFTLALNRFSHLTNEEMKAMLGSSDRPVIRKSQSDFVKDTRPTSTSWDWRRKGVVNQPVGSGKCGASDAFAVVAAMESQWAIQYNRLYKLSEQNIVDCGYNGCKGGRPIDIYYFIQDVQHGYFMNEADYPYVATEGDCKYDPNKRSVYMHSKIDVNEGDLDDLQAKVEHVGPVVVHLTNLYVNFYDYSEGIYSQTKTSSSVICNGVVVGFGSEYQKSFWIIRTSYGQKWGEAGYVRFERESAEKSCSITCNTFIPIPTHTGHPIV